MERTAIGDWIINRTRRAGLDTAVAALVSAFYGWGFWSQLPDDTLGMARGALVALHDNPQATILGTLDLSQYWRPWAADVVQAEEMMAYTYLAAVVAVLVVRALRVALRRGVELTSRSVPPQRASWAAARDVVWGASERAAPLIGAGTLDP